jgi:hypothetical protein|tara:strand:- start:46 stop:318 length:273 start_codon:yes stop_codon:yes gene_type:complete
MVHILNPDNPDPKRRKLYANPNILNWEVIVEDGVTTSSAKFGFINKGEPMLLAWTNAEYPVPIPLEVIELMLSSGWSTDPFPNQAKGEEE